MKLVKCTVCGYICEERNTGNACIKCGAPLEKFETLSDEAAKKINDADATNDIHLSIASLASQIIELAKKGAELDLDPACTKGFNTTQDLAWEVKQLAKAEIAGHVKKDKF